MSTKIVVTGGSHADRTAFIHMLRDKLPGVQIVPEAAVDVLSKDLHFFKGIADLPKELEYSFYEMVRARQIQLENEGSNQMSSRNTRFIVCNDGAEKILADLNESMPGFIENEKVRMSRNYGQDSFVIHLGSKPDSSTSKPDDSMALDRTSVIDNVLSLLWKNHPNYHFLPIFSRGDGANASFDEVFEIIGSLAS